MEGVDAMEDMNRGGFSASPIGSGIYQVWCPGKVSCFLAIGRDRALLMDSGYGLGDLRGFIAALTDRPVMLVNSHGHIDHVGGDFQFESAYINGLDEGLALRHSGREERERALEFLGRSDPAYACLGICELRGLPPERSFDLGSRVIDVLPCPGHTAGSVALFDRSTSILLSGDAFSRHVWLFDGDSTSIADLLESLRRARGIGFSAMYCSHSPERFAPSFLDDLERCARNISLEGSRPFSVPLAGAEALLYSEGGEPFASEDFVSIVFLPQKLPPASAILGKHLIYTYANGWQYEIYVKDDNHFSYRIHSGMVGGRWVTDQEANIVEIAEAVWVISWDEPTGTCVSIAVNLGLRRLHGVIFFPHWVHEDPEKTVCYQNEHLGLMREFRDRGPTYPKFVVDEFAVITFIEDCGPGRDDVICCAPSELPEGYAARRNDPPAPPGP